MSVRLATVLFQTGTYVIKEMWKKEKNRNKGSRPMGSAERVGLSDHLVGLFMERGGARPPPTKNKTFPVKIQQEKSLSLPSVRRSPNWSKIPIFFYKSWWTTPKKEQFDNRGVIKDKQPPQSRRWASLRPQQSGSPSSCSWSSRWRTWRCPRWSRCPGSWRGHFFW